MNSQTSMTGERRYDPFAAPLRRRAIPYSTNNQATSHTTPNTSMVSKSAVHVLGVDCPCSAGCAPATDGSKSKLTCHAANIIGTTINPST